MAKATTPTPRGPAAPRTAARRRKAATPPAAPDTADLAPDPAPTLRRKDLVERVVAASGRKKKDVKPVVEAMLSVLGEALSQGEVLNLPPLGRLSVTRRKEQPDGEVLITRIRRARPGAEPSNTPLAEPGEDG